MTDLLKATPSTVSLTFVNDKIPFVGWLVGWLGLWHINLCRLFNSKSIYMKIVLFQTIQFNISTQFK